MIRKIQHNAYGDPSVLEMVETDEPTPGEGEVRVSVKAVSLNPVDLKTFEGYKAASYRRDEQPFASPVLVVWPRSRTFSEGRGA